MIVDIAHHTKKLYTLIELSSTQNMAFPPEKEKNIILRESILVKSASTSSVKGLLGQKFDLKLRHIELVDWNQSTFLLIYKQKSGSLVPLLSIRLVPPLSIASGQADGFFQLFPTGGDDIVLNFTNRDSRDKWLDGIKTASSALKIAENPKGDIGVPESKGDDNNSVVSTSSAPNTTIPQLVMALKPNWENKSDNASIGQMGSSIYNEVSLPAVVRDRNHGLSRSLTIGGEHEPSARRRTKDTPAVDSMLAANKEPLIPQPTVPPRPEPHLSPIFNPHATPLYVVTHTNASMHLEELSEIDPLELVDEDPTPTIGSSTPGFVHKVVEKIEKKVHKTSHPPPDQPLGQDRQLTGETMSKIHQTVETVLIANSSETAGALKANEEDDQNLPAAPTETPLSTSPTPTSKMQLVDEVLSSPQSNLMRFLSSPMQPENAELLQTEVQALTLMNDQLNEALEASETMHRHEMETLYAEMLRLQAHLREVEQEKEFFISTNTEAMAQVFQMQTIQSEKDQVMVEYAELQVKYDTLLEQHNQAATVTQRLVSDQQECLDKVKVLEETLLRKDEELLAVNKKFISTSESLMQKTEELLAREQDSTNKLHELAEVGTENNILYEKVRVLEEVEVKYVGLQQELQSKCERIVTLEAELQQCKISIKSFQANEEAHFVTIARLESLIKEQQSFASELSTQLQIERKRKEELADMQVQHISLLEELHKVKGEKGEMDRDLARQKSAFSSLEKEIDRVKDEYEEKINKKNVEIQTKRKELEMHVMDMEHLVRESFYI
ncbi:hypothetical protein EON65_09150 [archaeon]|nr:MAG: hypothetical protein EON65_09150 [archaeon]